MKKPNPSVKERRAAQNRSKKRSDRLKKTQSSKHQRMESVKKSKAASEKKFKQYLNNLMPDQQM